MSKNGRGGPGKERTEGRGGRHPGRGRTEGLSVAAVGYTHSIMTTWLTGTPSVTKYIPVAPE